jgi:hypothetical protein
MTRRPATPRRQQTTVLLVGEGHAEVTWLAHLKQLYVTRGNGVSVSIKNARGKGAGHVIDFAIRQKRNAAYDRVLAVLDTDVDWGPHEQARAHAERVAVIPSLPCLEAMLLGLHAFTREGLSSTQWKKEFYARFGAAADEPSVYAEHFGRSVVQSGRVRIKTLDQLLEAMEKPGRRHRK